MSEIAARYAVVAQGAGDLLGAVGTLELSLPQAEARARLEQAGRVIAALERWARAWGEAHAQAEADALTTGWPEGLDRAPGYADLAGDVAGAGGPGAAGRCVPQRSLQGLPVLRAAAEAAGEPAVRAMVELLAEYVDTDEALERARGTGAAALRACEAAETRLSALEGAVVGYRRAATGLVQCLRERQRRDPFRVDATLRGLLRTEQQVIGALHAHDQAAVMGPLWDLLVGERAGKEVGHA